MKLARAALRILRFYRDFGAGFVTGGVTVAALMIVAMVSPPALRLGMAVLEHHIG